MEKEKRTKSKKEDMTTEFNDNEQLNFANLNQFCIRVTSPCTAEAAIEELISLGFKLELSDLLGCIQTASRVEPKDYWCTFLYNRGDELHSACLTEITRVVKFLDIGCRQINTSFNDEEALALLKSKEFIRRISKT